jgi:hypothetical protein
MLSEDQNIEKFICLNRLNASWRMDGSMFVRFMKHVSGYFRINEPDQALDTNTVDYAEIASEDLNTVSLIFGGHSPQEDTILLVPVNPGECHMSKAKGFRVKVYSKETHTKRSLHLNCL